MKKIAIRITPYAVIGIITIACAFAFKDSLQINLSSLEPLFVIAVLAFQAVLLCSKSAQKADNYSTVDFDLTGSEKGLYLKTIGISTVYIIPLVIPALIFFDIWAKIAISLSAVLLTYIVGSIVFRIKYGKAIRQRIEEDSKD
ncbi:MAG: hypothetical protein IJ309_01215 [Clostridia bacterium]|nr:hypothetical protein [Clostridia bacterium]